MVQIVALARTTLRNIIGTMTLKDANSERGKINSALYTTWLQRPRTGAWNRAYRTEEINPPTDVQETMNKVVKASTEKNRRNRLCHGTRNAGRRRTPRRDQSGRGTKTGCNPAS